MKYSAVLRHLQAKLREIYECGGLKTSRNRLRYSIIASNEGWASAKR